jgi:hypothetical protein
MKQKRQLVILIALVVIAAGIWSWYFRGEKPVVTADMGGTGQYQPIKVEDPKPRVDEIDRARKTEYKNVGGRNIFSRDIPPPPPTKEQIKKASEAAQAQQPQIVVPPPPVVQPLPAKFFGFGTVPNGTVRLAFLTNGEDVFVVREGEVFLNHFRILKINNTNLDYEDTTTNLRGSAPLEEQAAPGSPG